jgi:hypothetical protein
VSSASMPYTPKNKNEDRIPPKRNYFLKITTYKIYSISSKEG